MRILITGAGGQLGHDLMAVLAADDVKATDLAHLDITNRAAVVSTVVDFRPDWIINSAAYNDVDGAESAQKAAFAINASGPGNLADPAAEAGIKLVHISSDYVFDGRKEVPTRKRMNQILSICTVARSARVSFAC